MKGQKGVKAPMASSVATLTLCSACKQRDEDFFVRGSEEEEEGLYCRISPDLISERKVPLPQQSFTGDVQ